MKWTTDTPKETGFYWCLIDEEVTMVEVYRMDHSLEVNIMGCDIYYDVGDFEWWMGPIEQPQGPVIS